MSDPLSNQTFVFTGEMSIPRDEAQQKVIMLGGRVTTAPSGRTTYLVAGTDPGPSKMQKAADLDIVVLSEQEFLDIIKTCEVGFDDEMAVNVQPAKKRKTTEDKKIEKVSDKVGDKVSKKTDEVGDKVGKEEKIIKKEKKAGRDNDMWSEKYRPTKSSELVANAGILDQLREFLVDTKKKAALLSGHPGVGKTIAAQVICNELGFDIIEFNASDTRNKSAIVTQIAATLNTHALSRSAGLNRKVLIMDEVDGMTSDRGGLAELNSIIKKSKIKIICICNDRNNPKIRTLANHCVDLRFRRPLATQIMPRIKTILKTEGKQIKDTMLNEVLKTSNGDLRYTLNILQSLAMRDTLSHIDISTLVKKSTMKSLFETASEIFHHNKIADKMDMYFEDYSMMPLFVQENYLKTNFKSIAEIQMAAECISYSDIVDKQVRYGNEWSLLPTHAIFSSIAPLQSRTLTKRIDFPQLLGQNSKRAKNLRNLCEVLLHAHRSVRMDKVCFRLYCTDLLFRMYVYGLIDGDIPRCIELLRGYDLVKTDLDGLADIVFEGAALMKNAGTKNKSALTREYKKLKRTLPYSVDETKKVVKSDESDEDE